MTLDLDIQRLAAEIAAELVTALPGRPIPRYYAIPTVAVALDCSPDQVRSLIISGELEAIDIADKLGTRKSQRVTHDSLTGFLDRRKKVS